MEKVPFFSFLCPELADEVGQGISAAEDGPMWLSQWKPWLAATVLLIVLAYGPVLFETIRTAEFTSPGYVVW